LAELREDFRWASLVPELIVSDLQRSLHFWCDLIGFGIAYERVAERFAYLELGQSQAMLSEQAGMDRWITGEMAHPFGRGVNLQIAVEDMAAPLDRLKNADWGLYFAPEEKWYGAGQIETGVLQFAVADPDGYLLRLSQSLGQRPAKAESASL
jgi:catechol 2,3-dioxygenase-like lactoylglutathione lyase family enzyme